MIFDIEFFFSRILKNFSYNNSSPPLDIIENFLDEILTDFFFEFSVRDVPDRDVIKKLRENDNEINFSEIDKNKSLN